MISITILSIFLLATATTLNTVRDYRRCIINENLPYIIEISIIRQFKHSCVLLGSSACGEWGIVVDRVSFSPSRRATSLFFW
jgi:hypothetical protein